MRSMNQVWRYPFPPQLQGSRIRRDSGPVGVNLDPDPEFPSPTPLGRNVHFWFLGFLHGTYSVRTIGLWDLFEEQQHVRQLLGSDITCIRLLVN